MIVVDTDEELQKRMPGWQKGLKRGGITGYTGKSEVVASCKEGGEIIRIEGPDGKEFKQVQNSKYLQSRREEKGGTEGDIIG